MAEATDSLHLAQLRTRLSIAARTRALESRSTSPRLGSAPKAYRVSQFSHAELRAFAEAYLADHRELAAEPFAGGRALEGRKVLRQAR